MPIVHEPRPLPSPLTYVPPQGVRYKVATMDSFDTLIMRPDVRAAGATSSPPVKTANDLAFFNFKTRNPPEINWYLFNKVGCRRITHDGKNYMFSSGDQPGLIYLPAVGSAKAVQPAQQGEPLNAWFGVGVKAGTQFVVPGIETVIGWVVSLDEVGRGIGISASINRLGLGVGATIGHTLIYVTGVSNASRLCGWQQGSTSWRDLDFNVTVGENWEKLLGGGKIVKKLQPLISAFRKINAWTPEGLKGAMKREPKGWIDLIQTARKFKESLEIERSEPNVFMFEIPFIPSYGLEVSLFYSVQNFNAIPADVSAEGA
jgi:hypothetical protein